MPITIQRVESPHGRCVRLTSEDVREDVEAFVARHRLEVDWSEAWVSSMGQINGRRFEQWRLPIVDRPGEDEWALTVLEVACKRLGIEPPEDSGGLAAWGQEDAAKRAALVAARAPRVDVNGRAWNGAAALDDGSEPIPRVWSSVEEHANAVCAAFRQAGA